MPALTKATKQSPTINRSRQDAAPRSSAFRWGGGILTHGRWISAPISNVIPQTFTHLVFCGISPTGVHRPTGRSSRSAPRFSDSPKSTDDHSFINRVRKECNISLLTESIWDASPGNQTSLGYRRHCLIQRLTVSCQSLRNQYHSTILLSS